MTDQGFLDLGKPARRVRLATLVGLRWLAIAGQSAAVLLVYVGLGFPLPFLWCLVIIASSGLVNLSLRLAYPQTHRLDDNPAAILLGFDIVQLSALLYLTGGLTNPFAMLFLAPLMISAASLSPRRTLLLGLLTALAATILVVHHLPLPWFPGQSLDLPPIFSLGTWMAIVLGSAFTGAFASRVAEEARQLADALTATELVLAREQHLTQLDGLAAAAAHELGTPLATITLVVKELLSILEKTPEKLDSAVRDDVVLLDQEVGRCRTILRRLASLGNETAGPMENMTISHLIEEVLGPQRHFGVSLTANRRGEGDEPICVRNPGILYGLGNLVENAIDYANRAVQIDSTYTRDVVKVCIADDGPGFSADILARLGDPYVTSRHASRKAKFQEGSGLGLGLFIAKTLLERSGATFETANRPSPETGAVVTVTWQRAAFERGHPKPAGIATARRQALQTLQGL